MKKINNETRIFEMGMKRFRVYTQQQQLRLENLSSMANKFELKQPNWNRKTGCCFSIDAKLPLPK